MKILHSIIYSGIIIILKNTETKLEILLRQLHKQLKRNYLGGALILKGFTKPLLV